MNFIPVDHIPKKNTPQAGEYSEFKPMHNYLREFMKMNAKAVQVIFKPSEYANAKSAYVSLRQAIGRYKLPIKASMRGNEVYLTRTDMED